MRNKIDENIYLEIIDLNKSKFDDFKSILKESLENNNYDLIKVSKYFRNYIEIRRKKSVDDVLWNKIKTDIDYILEHHDNIRIICQDSSNNNFKLNYSGDFIYNGKNVLKIIKINMNYYNNIFLEKEYLNGKECIEKDSFKILAVDNDYIDYCKNKLSSLEGIKNFETYFAVKTFYDFIFNDFIKHQKPICSRGNIDFYNFDYNIYDFIFFTIQFKCDDSLSVNIDDKFNGNFSHKGCYVYIENQRNNFTIYEDSSIEEIIDSKIKNSNSCFNIFIGNISKESRYKEYETNLKFENKVDILFLSSIIKHIRENNYLKELYNCNFIDNKNSFAIKVKNIELLDDNETIQVVIDYDLLKSNLISRTKIVNALKRAISNITFVKEYFGFTDDNGYLKMNKIKIKDSLTDKEKSEIEKIEIEKLFEKENRKRERDRKNNIKYLNSKFKEVLEYYYSHNNYNNDESIELNREIEAIIDFVYNFKTILNN